MYLKMGTSDGNGFFVNIAYLAKPINSRKKPERSHKLGSRFPQKRSVPYNLYTNMVFVFILYPISLKNISGSLHRISMGLRPFDAAR